MEHTPPPDDPTPSQPAAPGSGGAGTAPGAGAAGVAAAGVAPPPVPDADRVSFRGMIEETVRVRARTANGIVREIQRLWPGFLEGKEGFVHPALLELRRQGRLRGDWMDLPEGRRRVYRMSTGMTPAGPEREDGGLREPGAACRDLAARCAEDLAFAPRLREEARIEMARHLADATADRVRQGEAPEDAEAAAIAAFGDPWRIRVDLGRAARGKRTVIFPGTLRETMVGFAIYDLRVMMLIVAAMVFVRLQVVTAYHIPTKSMEPTLHGDPRTGDHILVYKGASEPERFDIWVFDGWGSERKNYVKRCVGLPGERLDLWHGDLYVDGKLVRKDGADLDALLFPLFDLEDEFARARRVKPMAPREELMRRVLHLWRSSSDAPENRWRPSEGRDALWAQVPDDWKGDPAELYWDDVVEDELYDPFNCELTGGIYEVADVRMTVDVWPQDASARVLLRLKSDPASYEAVLLDDRPGVTIRRRLTHLEEGEEVHEYEELAHAPDAVVAPDRYTKVRFSHVDRTLRLELDGELVLRADLPQLEKRPDDEVEESVPFVSVSRGSVAVRPLRLERDVHWNSDGGPTVQSPGPDEFFMLGDNSSNSTDSRTYGPTHRNRLVGTPLLVVWPFSGIRIPR